MVLVVVDGSVNGSAIMVVTVGLVCRSLITIIGGTIDFSSVMMMVSFVPCGGFWVKWPLVMLSLAVLCSKVGKSSGLLDDVTVTPLTMSGSIVTSLMMLMMMMVCGTI